MYTRWQTVMSTFGREWNRLGKQLTGVWLHLTGGLMRRCYDRRRGQLVRLTEGALPSSAEVAVLLIYQPQSVAASVFGTLACLANHGIAPVVVSNAALTEQDRTRLAAAAHLVIERPNIGYDFGGYREGVLTVLSRLPDIRTLHVMNDSMWFPLHDDCDAIARIGALDADLAGLYLGCHSRRQRRSYLQSYYYRFGEKVLRDPFFARYWRKMPLINHKHSVVRRFERELAGHFSRRGFRVDALIRWDRVIEELLALDDELLAKYLAYQCSVSPTERARTADLPDRGANPVAWRREAEALIRARRVFVNLTELHPQLLSRLGVPFLKKARTSACITQRRTLLAGDGLAGYSAEVADEIAARDG